MLFIRQIKLGIFDYEQAYVMSLMNFINADTDNSLFALAFSSKEGLLRYLKGNQLDMLLIAEKAVDDLAIKGSIDGINVVLLTEDEGPREEKFICKYSRAADICKRIVQTFRACEAVSRSDLYETYAVTSPIGRSGKTRVAKAICALDEVRGGLYVGMEAYAFDNDDAGSVQHGMSDLAYLIKTRSEAFQMYLDKSVSEVNGIGMIASPRSYTDIRELEYEDVRWFVEQLIEWGRYTTIVFDIGESVLADINIFAVFDKVVVTKLEDERSEAKLRCFKEVLNNHELGKVVGRMKEVQAPDVEYDEPEMVRYIGRLFGN